MSIISTPILPPYYPVWFILWGFFDLSTIDILDQKILCCGDSLVSCKMFRTTPDLCLQMRIIFFPQLWQPNTSSDIVKCPQVGGTLGIPRWLSDKESTCQCRRHRFHPWVRKIPWRRKWNTLQYSCLGNPIGRGAQWATVHGVSKELDSTWLSN